MTIDQFISEIKRGLSFTFTVYEKEYGISSCIGADYSLYLQDNNGNEIPFKIGISDASLTKDSIFNSVSELLNNYKIDNVPFRDVLKDISELRIIST